VAENPRQPVAIRIVRPYATEDEFLEHELETVTKTSVVLVGAQPRPQGVVLRFDLTLASGAPLVRGEGRVVSFRERAFGDLPGLTLRFTRLDTRSKALVDRAASIREARLRIPSEPPAAGREIEAPPPSIPISIEAPVSIAVASSRESSLPKAPDVPLEPPPPAERTGTTTRARGKKSAPPSRQPSRPPAPLIPITLDLDPTRAEAPEAKRADRSARRIEAPANREAILDRLRTRQKGLDQARVKAILTKR
jgi:hypothetical protein